MGESIDKAVKKRISMTLTEIFVEGLDQLVDKGLYLEHQVAIRDAMRRLFRYHKIAPFYSDFIEKVEKIGN